ncbi:MAG: hypothetical protein CL693_05340 [Cellvibrionaceae bacterium]|nr:hypothetical protein [Cellvibrionaceae bacterium]|tara:strand:+ start:748 stop:1119 length:372 start_codon:yes stop_codon:yes gene_type:complete
MAVLEYESNIELIGNILHTHPQGDFDLIALKEHAEKVIAMTETLDRWALFEHTMEDAGLSTTSMTYLFETYRSFSEHGCQGIAIGGESLFVDIIPSYVVDGFSVPLKISHCDQELQSFLQGLI